MSQSVPFFIKADSRGCSILVGSVFRQALVEIGYSPDRHIYDLDREYVHRRSECAAGAFLEKVIGFYDSLPIEERKIFLCDCLERGRHYVWWWYECFDRHSYNRVMNKLLVKVHGNFMMANT